jgi:hypothetical protein
MLNKSQKWATNFTTGPRPITGPSSRGVPSFGPCSALLALGYCCQESREIFHSCGGQACCLEFSHSLSNLLLAGGALLPGRYQKNVPVHACRRKMAGTALAKYIHTCFRPAWRLCRVAPASTVAAIGVIRNYLPSTASNHLQRRSHPITLDIDQAFQGDIQGGQ